MPTARIVMLAAAASLVAAAPAAAQSPLWPASPTILSTADRDLGDATLAFTGDGHALATAWLSTGNLVSPSEGQTRLFAAAPGSTTFRARGSAVLAAAPAPYATRHAAYLRLPGTSGSRTLSPADPVRLGASVAPVSESGIGTFQELTTRAKSPVGAALQGADIAATPAGDVAAAWIERRDDDSILRLSLRKPGARFGAPTTIVGAGAVSSIALAYGANGDLVVAFQRTLRSGGTRTRGVYVRIKRKGRQIGPIESLGPSSGYSVIAAAAAGDGSAVVGWGTQDTGEEANLPWTVRAALRKRGATSFSSAQVLDPGGRPQRPAGTVSATIADGGAATVAWSGISPRGTLLTYPVRAAGASPGGRFAAPVTLAASGAATSIATAPDGTTTVVWGLVPVSGDYQRSEQILAGVRRRGGSFGLPEAVSDRARAGFGQVAIDPVRERPAVLWVAGAALDAPLGRTFAAPELRYAVRALP